MVITLGHDETHLLFADQNQRARAGGALTQSPCPSARGAGGGVCAAGGVQRISPRRITNAARVVVGGNTNFLCGYFVGSPSSAIISRLRFLVSHHASAIITSQ